MCNLEKLAQDLNKSAGWYIEHPIIKPERDRFTSNNDDIQCIRFYKPYCDPHVPGSSQE
jgi:hypothetical protein